MMAQVEYEHLLRALMDLPNRPAIINVHVFGLVFDPISQGGDQVWGRGLDDPLSTQTND